MNPSGATLQKEGIQAVAAAQTEVCESQNLLQAANPSLIALAMPKVLWDSVIPSGRVRLILRFFFSSHPPPPSLDVVITWHTIMTF